MEKNNATAEKISRKYDKCRDVSFKYTFRSDTGIADIMYYVKQVTLEIMLCDDRGYETESIGQIDFIVIHMDSALTKGDEIFDFFSCYEYYLHRHTYKVYNCEKKTFVQPIIDKYNHDLMGHNTCFIKNVSILPKYRGQQLALKAIKDIIFNYQTSCTLFIMNPSGLQHETKVYNNLTEDLELEKFTETEKEAFTKLQHYFEGMGFETIPRIPDMLFFNTAMRNDKLDAIDLTDICYWEE